MLNFLAAEDHHTLNRQSALLQSRSPTRHRPLPSSSSTISSSANRQRRRQRQPKPHSSSFQSTSSATSVGPQHGFTRAMSFFDDAAAESHLPEGFFPDLGLSWRDPRRRGGRDYLRRARLKKEVKEHKKLLHGEIVLYSCVFSPVGSLLLTFYPHRLLSSFLFPPLLSSFLLFPPSSLLCLFFSLCLAGSHEERRLRAQKKKSS